MKYFQREKLLDNMLLSTKLLIVVWLLRLHSILAAVVVNRQVDNVSSCNLPEPLLKEIDSYEIIARAIMNEALKGSFKGTTWTGLSYFTEKFGPRLSGSQPLERSIDYVLKESADYGLENVHGENVTVPFWVRQKLFPLILFKISFKLFLQSNDSIELKYYLSFQRRRISNSFESQANGYRYSGIRHQHSYPATRRYNRGGYRSEQFRRIDRQEKRSKRSISRNMRIVLFLLISNISIFLGTWKDRRI